MDAGSWRLNNGINSESWCIFFADILLPESSGVPSSSFVIFHGANPSSLSVGADEVRILYSVIPYPSLILFSLFLTLLPQSPPLSLSLSCYFFGRLSEQLNAELVAITMLLENAMWPDAIHLLQQTHSQVRRDRQTEMEEKYCTISFIALPCSPHLYVPSSAVGYGFVRGPPSIH